MNKKELTEYFCERLAALPAASGRGEDYRRLYYECLQLTRSRGYSERAFADMWYNACLWHEAVSANRCA